LRACFNHLDVAPIFGHSGLLAKGQRAKHPEDPVIQYHVGLVSIKVGDKDGARRALTSALSSLTSFAGKDEARKALAKIKSNPAGYCGTMHLLAHIC